MNELATETFPLDGNRLIEASAGTGKTYTITNLYLRLLLGRTDAFDRPLAVDEILVLTFTIAATEELRSRIRARVLEARRLLAGEEEPKDEILAHLKATSTNLARDVKLLSAALQLMDEASIFTIHAFCARVLSDNAFETSTLFDQSLDADRDVLLETAVEDCFRSHILTLPPMQRAIALNLWRSPEQLQMKLKPFLFRANLTLLPPEQDISRALDTLLAKISNAKQGWISENIPALIESAGFRKKAKALSRLEAMTEWCKSGELETDLWENWTRGYMETVITKGGAIPTHPILDLIEEIWAGRDIIQQAQFNLWHRVTARVRANLERYKIELSQLTLDDLLIKVHSALAQPQTGAWLAADLAKRWPVAMIDEFQDTDDIQFGIFNAIYRGVPDTGLHFIGDPKQAIYQFRGADVFTYINAKRQVDRDTDVFSLAINWRSTESLVAAINTLFNQPFIFDNDADIPFVPVSPSPAAKTRSFTEDRKPVAPVTLTEFAAAAGQLGKDVARRLCMEHAAEETARLLTSAAEGNVLIDGKPLHAGQIAFLVRDKNDARAAREALGARNIRSVYVTLESVFLTETADDLKLVLQAVLEPTNERALRAALAVPLMQSSATEIASLSNDVTAQQRVLQEFLEYHRLWATMDVATMIEGLMVKRRIAQKWFGKQDGERQMTNLRHLTELLQRRASVAPGMHRLLKWFTREKLAADTVAVEERQLRLESDRDLVQIVTMHASKGLEYDIVMIPMAAFVAQDRTDEPCLSHEVKNNQFRTLLDFSADINHREQATAEKQAEDMRLLYVAITRAKYKCYLGVPIIRDLARSALGRLLRLRSFGADEVEQTLRTNFEGELFDVARVSAAGFTEWRPPRRVRDLNPPPTAPVVRDRWRLHSYTGVSRMIRTAEEEQQQAVLDVTPGFGDDETDSQSQPGTRIDRYTFPKGPRAGVALHTLLEDLDFQSAAADQTTIIEQCLDRVGLIRNRRDWLDVLTGWTHDILTTPLPMGARLADIGRDHRLDEMEFHFPLSTDARLIDVLKSGGYLTDTASLNVEHLNGMMTGLIDLVFEHDGKYWLADYKSNHLGNEHGDYAEAQVTDAMRHHQYDLQYLIYCVALNRYLMSRVPGYTYAEKFGGVCYLFLRGMKPGSGHGVFFDRPEEAFLDRLDAILEGKT